MSRPPLEVADLIRVAGQKFIEASRRWITGQHLKVLAAIARCRTAALGGHRDRCARCGYRAHSFNSCRNRHCPKCQAHARDQWLRARRRELLPTPYVHVIFTIPRRLAPLALQNKKVIYDLLFRTCAETLLEVARDPRHLGGEIGFFGVLHSWNQKLEHHPHIHCVIPAGGISPDHPRWVPPRYPGFFLPVKVLGRVFRGKFIAGLQRLYRRKQLRCAGPSAALADAKQFRQLLRRLHRRIWVVYAKPAFGGPRQVLRYLGRYTRRLAISHHRLVSFDGERVTFRWKDYAHGSKQKMMTLSATEFLRRFFLHVLPKGFVRIRYFGFLANRWRAEMLALALQLLGATPIVTAERVRRA